MAQLYMKSMLGKNVGFACHIFGCELCRNRSGTAFFGEWFRMRTFFTEENKSKEAQE